VTCYSGKCRLVYHDWADDGKTRTAVDQTGRNRNHTTLTDDCDSQLQCNINVRAASATPLLGPEPALGIRKCLVREAIENWTETQHLRAWIDLPGLRHGKLFIGRPCKKRADDLLKLGRRQLKMITVIYTGHAPVRGHLYTMGLFDGDPICRFCGIKTERVWHIICCREALARQRFNVFGRLIVERAASIRDLCLFIRGAGLLRLC